MDVEGEGTDKYVCLSLAVCGYNCLGDVIITLQVTDPKEHLPLHDGGRALQTTASAETPPSATASERCAHCNVVIPAAQKVCFSH